METAVKRSLSSDNDSEAKRLKVEPINILHFSDCVLSIIFSYLKPYDLYCLSKTCQRFKYLIKERKLWRKLDVLDHPMCARKFKFFFDNVNNCTDLIMVSGISKKEKTLTFSQFIRMYKICDNLTILAIEFQYINSDEIRLKDFPESLQELSLRGTHIYGRDPFLHDANLRLHKLHTLILDDCKWFHEHSLMALSKLCSLENLSLYKCGNLNDSVAYMSITAKFGFRKLLRIDARCTSIGDQFLKCFHCIKTLREIYLEAPQRRENKKNLYDEIKRLCASDIQETPSAVVFNRNNIFKMRRDRIKSVKKPRKSAVSTQQLSNHVSGFNCLENCENCSVETCSFIPSGRNFYPVLDSSTSGNDNPNSESVGKVNSSDGQESAAKVGGSEGEKSPFEIYFCDDVSDSEDEIVDFEIFHSDVTDSGVQWFCTSDPDSTDNLGNESFLFKKPYKDCTCRKKEDFQGDNDKAGPSGLNLAGPSKLKPSTTGAKKAQPSQNNSSSSEEKEKEPSGHRHNSEEKNLPHRRFHNDVTVNVSGQGAVCLKIAYDSSDSSSDTEPPEEAPRNPSVPANVAADPAVAEPPPLGPQQLRGRDLRVIIERLDPGVHIVYDQRGRVHQFDNYVKDYTTKLKVFVARGYKLITNHALRSLMDLRLELLDVTGTSVSAKGVREFLMVNPDCRVIHESTCTCY